MALSAPRVATVWLYFYDPATLARLRGAACAHLRARLPPPDPTPGPAPPTHSRAGARGRAAAQDYPNPDPGAAVLDGDHSAFSDSEADWLGAEAPSPDKGFSGDQGLGSALGGAAADARGARGVGEREPRSKLMPCGADACGGGAPRVARPYRQGKPAGVRAWRYAWLLRLAASDWAFWELTAFAPSLQVSRPCAFARMMCRVALNPSSGTELSESRWRSKP